MSKDLNFIRDNIAEARAQLKQGIKLNDDQCQWLFKTIELQLTVIETGEAFIEALDVANLRKDIEIYELKETLGKDI